MKKVDNLTVSNIKGTGIIRRKDWDFSDDGNRFRCFEYKGLRISCLKSDGEIYCAIHEDDLTQDIPYSLWSKTEEHGLEWKYNGGVNEIDIDDLVDICERIIKKVPEVRKQFEEMDITTQYCTIIKKLDEEREQVVNDLDWFKNINWFDLIGNKDAWYLKEIGTNYNYLKEELVKIDKAKMDISTGDMTRKDAFEKARHNHVVTDGYWGKRLHEMYNDLYELARKENRI